MPFPEARRVIYGRNPLDRVICQLRFPPILRIDVEIPANFQERIRADFPKFVEKTEFRIDLPILHEGDTPTEMLSQVVPMPGNKNYEFASEDDTWRVNLTRSFIALTATRYQRWEEFRETLRGPVDALFDIYSPTHIARVGLRYIDLIRRSVLGLDAVPWGDLMNPHLVGLLGSPDVGRYVQSLETAHEIRLSDGESSVRLITRLVELPETGESCFVIDSDFYNASRLDTTEVQEKLDYFNQRGSRLIQWCIADRLHEAMEPLAL